MKFKALTTLSVTLLTFALVQSTVAQDTQYGQGLLLDYFVIQNPDDVKEPTGRSMATLVDTSVPQMSYLGPFEIEPALKQFRDKLWGLSWSGFLKVDDPGPYSFNLLINTTSERPRDDRYGVTCQSWLKLQNRVIAGHELQLFRDGNVNAYGDIDLQPGIYQLNVWLACSSVGAYTNIDAVKPIINLNMRGPNDAMLKPIPKNQLLHEL